MGVLESILAGIVAIFKAIPYFDKWFSPNLEKQVKKEKEKARKGMDEFKKSGRPPE